MATTIYKTSAAYVNECVIAEFFAKHGIVPTRVEMIPIVTEDEEPIDWAKMWGITTPAAPAAPEPPKEKPLPTFHNRPRTYAKNLKDWEER